MPPIPTRARPAKGVAGVEPTFGTCLVRATDHAKEGAEGFARNDYSRRQAFNADDTRLLVYALDETQVHEVASDYLADAVAHAAIAGANASATTVGYIAARAVDAATPGAFARERRWQSAWLADRLGVQRPRPDPGAGQPALAPAALALKGSASML